MPKKYIIIVLFSLFIISGCKSYTVYIVRHAEKELNMGSNPPLTKDGKIRAEKLSRILRNKNIEAIYSTNTIRTLSTASPTQEIYRIPTQIYDTKSIDSLDNILNKSQKNTLIVGHSNTVPLLVNKLSNSNFQKIDLLDNEYDKLFKVKSNIFKNKKITVISF